MAMTHEESEAFALDWAAAWNRRAIDVVLERFHEDVVFTSPTALAVVNSPVVRGKDALRAYWSTALARIGSLRFSVDRVVWDPARLGAGPRAGDWRVIAAPAAASYCRVPPARDLDTAFYDAHYQSGAYLQTHAEHMAVWQGAESR